MGTMKDKAKVRKRVKLDDSKKPANIGTYVIQKHDAPHLHYDFRIEIDGVLKSWAIPNGPSIYTKDKRLAIPTEDHPIEYAKFEGVIQEGAHGAGNVMLWDSGKYRNLKKENGRLVSMSRCYKNGHIEIFIKGKRIHGGYALIRFRGNNWLLVKMKDEFSNVGSDPIHTQLRSVKTNRTMDEISKAVKNKKQKK
jgi:DNA ligase D-like protein (predicted 3'-phosphoesterase)